MARETKIGLLVGLAVILIVGIIVSDHLSAVRKQEPAAGMIRFAPSAESGLNSENKTNVMTDAGTMPPADPNAPKIPLPGEVEQPAAQPAGENGVTPLNPNTNQLKPGATIAAGGSPNVVPLPPAIPNSGTSAQTGPLIHQVNNPVPNAGTAKPTLLATHTVKKGDTLYSIAKVYYKDSSKWTLIQEANATALGSKNRLKDGMKLSIPSLKPAAPAATPATTIITANTIPATPTTTSGSTIEVKPGDTLATMAARTLGSKTKWKDLYSANRDQLKKEQDLRVGMILHVPGVASSTKVTTTNLAPLNIPIVSVNAPVLSLASNHSLAPVSANAPIATAPIATKVPTPAATVPPSTVKTLAATTTIKSAPSTYTVKSGDTLTTIATRTLGDASKWKKIFAANKSDMDSPSDLYAGQVLRIPAKS